MKVVVTHRGARDAYQTARALHEKGMLDRLITDLYWPADRTWAALVERTAGEKIKRALRLRNEPVLPSAYVETAGFAGPLSFVLDKIKAVPFSVRRAATRWNDAVLGRVAGRRANRTQSALLSYSYYGHSAFSVAQSGIPRILFQLHPHPSSVRRILEYELAAHPDCAASLRKEWELALPPEDFRRLVDETAMAQHWIAASSFTRTTLVENGAHAARIHVVPYGVDLERFRPLHRGRRTIPRSRPLHLLFVGTINQRKGIKYLLEAVRAYSARHVELRVCGRAVDDLHLFRGLGEQVRVHVSVSAAELNEAYQWADMFVFPSVAEGFGHVLLEAMASGLPVLSTTSTAAPDLIAEGVEGFVVAPSRSDALMERIGWAVENRNILADMGVAARDRAEDFTWEAFRERIAAAVTGMIQPEPARKAEASHV